jgi:hypothetical protein
LAETKASTFRIMDDKGNCINHIKMADSERDGDDFYTRIAKRLADAQKKRNKWAGDYLRDEKLTIVLCDAQGYPVK